MARKREKTGFFCPFKKAVSVEFNGASGRKEVHERFEECAGERCVAYSGKEIFTERPRCMRLEVENGQR